MLQDDYQVTEGWSNLRLRSISADGWIMTGTGISPQGQQEEWTADLRPVVVLHWDDTAPVAWGAITIDKCGDVFTALDRSTDGMPRPRMLEQTTRGYVAEEVRKKFAMAGVTSLIVTDKPTPGATDVYFVNELDIPIEIRDPNRGV